MSNWLILQKKMELRLLILRPKKINFEYSQNIENIINPFEEFGELIILQPSSTLRLLKGIKTLFT